MLFCCLWHNVETSCYKHFFVVSRHQQTPPLTTSYKCHNLPRSGGTVVITPGGRSVDSTRWSQILVGNRDFCLSHLHSTPPAGLSPLEYCHDVWYKKTRMVWLPTVKRFEGMFICFDKMHKRDRRTDRRTYGQTWRHRPRLHSITRQKLSDIRNSCTIFIILVSFYTQDRNEKEIDYEMHKDNLYNLEWLPKLSCVFTARHSVKHAECRAVFVSRRSAAYLILW